MECGFHFPQDKCMNLSSCLFVLICPCVRLFLYVRMSKHKIRSKNWLRFCIWESLALTSLQTWYDGWVGCFLWWLWWKKPTLKLEWWLSQWKHWTFFQRALFGYQNPSDNSEWRTVCISSSTERKVLFYLVQAYMWYTDIHTPH